MALPNYDRMRNEVFDMWTESCEYDHEYCARLLNDLMGILPTPYIEDVWRTHFEEMENEMTDKQTPDYIATINGGLGMGSWAREERLEDAVSRVAKIFHSDFGSIADIDGKDVPVTVYDVRGHDSLHISPMGVCPVDTEEYLPVYHTTEVTLPKKNRRKSA